MWYKESGKDYDVVISTRVRYARNIAGYKFPHIMKKNELEDIVNKLDGIIDKSKYSLLKMKNIDEVTSQSLMEKHLISKEFMKNTDGAIITNKENSIVTMVNEEDHLRLQSFSAGFSVENCYNKLKEFTDELNEKVDFAKNDNYGYLTSCPTNVGSGMRVSVMLHLPALGKLGLLNKLFAQINDIGMSVRGIYGENTQGSGYIYQISNQRTLGMSDENIIANIQAIITTIIEQERKARSILKENSYTVENEVYRSYGILKYARIIDDKEALRLLSKVRLGISMGFINDITLEKVTSLMLDIRKNSLQLLLKENLDDNEEIKRADYIRKEMN
jgi:protein arginine kinase